MQRRTFHSYFAMGLGSLFFGVSRPPAPTSLIKPRRLAKGDVIGLITPGSYISDESLEKAVSNLESLGFVVKMGKHIRAKHGFVAGTDAQRLEDLHSMFGDSEVAGVWCARGGYGCSRLLPALDYELIRKHPKVLIGYSDITALIQAIHLRTGLIAFHGPVASSDMTAYTEQHFVEVVMEGRSPLVITPPDASDSAEAYQPYVLKGGRKRGRLAGGNLSLLAALAGTPFALDASEKIVFIEEIGEEPYRVDRMLTQLQQSAALDKAAGLALGVFEDCEAANPDNSLDLRATLEGQTLDFNLPTDYGHAIGHISNQCTLPVGVMAELDADQHQITLLEAGVA